MIEQTTQQIKVMSSIIRETIEGIKEKHNNIPIKVYRVCKKVPTLVYETSPEQVKIYALGIVLSCINNEESMTFSKRSFYLKKFTTKVVYKALLSYSMWEDVLVTLPNGVVTRCRTQGECERLTQLVERSFSG